MSGQTPGDDTPGLTRQRQSCECNHPPAEHILGTAARSGVLTHCLHPGCGCDLFCGVREPDDAAAVPAEPKRAPEPTTALFLSAIARLSEGLREVQRACERGDAIHAVAPVAAAALADAGRLQLPAPAPAPPLEVRPGEAIVMRPDGGETLIIAFAPNVPPERVAEVSHNLHHASGLKVIAVADVAAVKGWQPDAEPPAPELSEVARLAQDALSDITRMCASSDSGVGLRDIRARALAGLGLLDPPEPGPAPELAAAMAETRLKNEGIAKIARSIPSRRLLSVETAEKLRTALLDLAGLQAPEAAAETDTDTEETGLF